MDCAPDVQDVYLQHGLIQTSHIPSAPQPGARGCPAGQWPYPKQQKQVPPRGAGRGGARAAAPPPRPPPLSSLGSGPRQPAGPGRAQSCAHEAASAAHSPRHRLHGARDRRAAALAAVVQHARDVEQHPAHASQPLAPRGHGAPTCT